MKEDIISVEYEEILEDESLDDHETSEDLEEEEILHKVTPEPEETENLTREEILISYDDIPLSTALNDLGIISSCLIILTFLVGAVLIFRKE